SAVSDLHPLRLRNFLTRRLSGREQSDLHPLTSRSSTVKPSGSFSKFGLFDSSKQPLTRKLAGASPRSINFFASSGWSGEPSDALSFRKRLKRIEDLERIEDED